jgi:hypothetical protein
LFSLLGVGARRSLALAWWKLRIFSTDLLARAREPEGSTCQCPMPLLLPPAAPWLGPIADIFSDTLTDSGGQWQRLTRPKWVVEDKENAADSTRAERNTAQWKRECSITTRLGGKFELTSATSSLVIRPPDMILFTHLIKNPCPCPLTFTETRECLTLQM